MALADYVTLATDLVRDDSGRLTAEEIERAVKAAVLRLSDKLPRQVVTEQTDVSGKRLAFAGTSWQRGVSALKGVEYPVGDTPPTFIDAADVQVLEKTDGTQEIGVADALPAASTVRFHYSAPHLVTAQQDTVPEAQRLGVSLLAASLLCGQLASLYANQTDSTIAADAVDHKTKSELWAAREKRYEAQAYSSWGLMPPTASASQGATAEAAGTVVSFPPRRGVKRWPVI